VSRIPRRTITSSHNPHIKQLVNLRKSKVRVGAGVALVEGYSELGLALKSGSRPVAIYVCGELGGDPSQLRLLDQPEIQEVEVVELSPAAFKKVSMRESPDGWLAVVPAPQRALDQLPLSSRPLVLVCEAIEKPGNLGAMLRTAEAAGVDAVLAASAATDWGNPNVVRASRGTVFAVPVSSAPSDEVSRWLQELNFQVAVAEPSATANLTDVDLQSDRLAVVVGSEHAGLSQLWTESGALAVAIPMVGLVNSLNVSVASGIFLYEVLRQRSQRLQDPP
jgi:RNA methyltransferase, TrmH family